MCRGPKPAVVLRKHGIPVRVNAPSPHTTPELLEVLPEELVRGRGVALLHDGGGNAALVEALRARGAHGGRAPHLRVAAPRRPRADRGADPRAARRPPRRRRRSPARCRCGTCSRSPHGRIARPALRFALRHRTIVGSIGPTCSAALEQFDVPPHVVASPPKMRPLVTAVGQFLAERRSHHTAETDP